MRRLASIAVLLALLVVGAVPSGAAPDKRPVTAKRCAKPAFKAKHRKACRKLARRNRPQPTATATPTPAVATPTPAPTTVDPRPFAPSSFWNARLGDNEALDPASDLLIDDLQRQLLLGPPWINTTSYSTPVYEVPADQPTVRVELIDAARVDPDLQKAWEEVPLPADAKPAQGTDGTVVVWQPSTDTMWEFWRLARTGDGGWRAEYGGRMRNLSRNPGHYTEPHDWGASATSLPWLGGLMRVSELRASRIDHALAMAIPQARANTWSFPAQRTDGRSLLPNVLPLGARLRLDPKLDLDSLSLPQPTRAIAEAAQKYGIVLRDTAGTVAFYGEDVGGAAYYGTGGIFAGVFPDVLLTLFPWDRLQVLRMDLRSG